MDCDQKGYFVGIVGGGPVAIHSSGQTVFSCSHITGITLGAGEEVDEVAGRASGMGVDGIGRLVTRLMKDRLLGCMVQVLQKGL